MKYLESILNFLTTIARMIFRNKRKHKPDRHAADSAGDPANEHRSVAGSHRGDTLAVPKNIPSSENLMGWALIVCAVSGYLLKLLA